MLIPEPAVARLCMTLRLLEQLDSEGTERVLSAELGQMLGVSAHSLRKDFCYLPEQSAKRKGYEVTRLAEAIRSALGLNRPRKACIVGLGRVGAALLSYRGFARRGYEIIVGFDSNVNKLETMRAEIELFPSYDIEPVVARKGIEIGIVAVPAAEAQKTAERLLSGGVSGILNFAPVAVKVEEGVVVRNVDFIRELDILASLVEDTTARRSE